MDLAFYLFIFLIGTCGGSFVNVLIDRLPSGQPIGFERSQCPHCQKRLSWWELVPIVSFIFLGGRCSQCKTRISWQYPLVESVSGLSFVLVFNKSLLVSRLQLASILNLVFWFFIVGLLIAIFVIDLKHLIIPNKLVYFGIFWVLTALFVDNFYSLIRWESIESSKLASLGWLPSSFIDLGYSVFTTHFLFAIMGAVFFLVLIVLTRGKGMGVGDLKLVFFLGLLFGAYLLDLIYLAFLLGGFAGIVLLVFQKKGLKSKVPFGPFLVSVALLFILF